jgi:hypothetical protein
LANVLQKEQYLSFMPSPLHRGDIKFCLTIHFRHLFFALSNTHVIFIHEGFSSLHIMQPAEIPVSKIRHLDSGFHAALPFTLRG